MGLRPGRGLGGVCGEPPVTGADHSRSRRAQIRCTECWRLHRGHHDAAGEGCSGVNRNVVADCECAEGYLLRKPLL